ncbi:hypothetical protein Dimus_017212 [Dionaea muscipula]
MIKPMPSKGEEIIGLKPSWAKHGPHEVEIGQQAGNLPVSDRGHTYPLAKDARAAARTGDTHGCPYGDAHVHGASGGYEPALSVELATCVHELPVRRSSRTPHARCQGGCSPGPHCPPREATRLGLVVR